MDDSSHSRRPSGNGPPSLVLAIVLAASASAVAVSAGGTLAAPLTAFAGLDRIGAAAISTQPPSISGGSASIACRTSERGESRQATRLRDGRRTG